YSTLHLAKEFKIHSDWDPQVVSEPGLQSVEERLVHYKKNETVFTEKINVLNLKVKLRDKVLAEYTPNLEKEEKERDELKLTLEKLQKSSKSLNTLLDSQVSDKSKAGLGYKELIPESFVNSSELLEKQDNTSDNESIDVSTVSSSDVKTVKTVDHKGMFSTEEPKPVRKNSFSPLIIEDWHSDDNSEDELSPTVEIQVSNGLGPENSLTSHLKIGTSSRRSLGKDDASKQGMNLKQRLIFKERDFDVQAMMDVDYELAARLRAEEQR
nr:hypothetical protein [Tanacetum cinerariifolium]